MSPSDKEHDGSGRDRHRRNRKGDQNEQFAHEEVSEGTTYLAGQECSGYSQEHTSYPPVLGPSSQNYGGYSSKFQATSPAFASTGQSYVQGTYDYQPHPQELSQSSDDVHTIPSAMAHAGRPNSTAEGIPESFMATFCARNMTMSEKTNEVMRKMGEEEADVTWANKYGACGKHKKDKKRCNPDKCPDNKSWVRRLGKEALTSAEKQSFQKALYAAYPDSTDRQERRKIIKGFYESQRSGCIKMTDKIWRLAQRKEAIKARLAEEKRTVEGKRAADERKRLHESCRAGYGDELEAMGKFDCDFGPAVENNEIAQEPSRAKHFATSIPFQPRNDECSNSSPYVQLSSTSSEVSGQAVIPSPFPSVENDPAQSSSEGIDHVPSQPNRHQVGPPAEPGQDPEPDQTLVFRIDATKAEEQQWRESGQTGLDSQEVPRTAWGGLGREDIHRYCGAGYSTHFDYVPENGSLALFDPIYTDLFNQNNASNRLGGDDEGSDDQTRGGGAPNGDEDYGDWGRNYYDGYGEGPSGSWQPNIGGGYPKGPGEFHALASELEERLAKVSLK
ncbi:hypothetical protein IFR05_001406 [Cadophora sp. M221]|nr:hypothetical protein IFR05_001406 [Cadophora sp. M221]